MGNVRRTCGTATLEWTSSPQICCLCSSVGGRLWGGAVQARSISLCWDLIMAGSRRLSFLLFPRVWGMGTTEGGQDNPACEMRSRGLPVSAGKMSGAEQSGGIERPSTLLQMYFISVGGQSWGWGWLPFHSHLWGWSWACPGRRIESQGLELLTKDVLYGD